MATTCSLDHVNARKVLRSGGTGHVHHHCGPLDSNSMCVHMSKSAQLSLEAGIKGDGSNSTTTSSAARKGESQRVQTKSIKIYGGLGGLEVGLSACLLHPYLVCLFIWFLERALKPVKTTNGSGMLIYLPELIVNLPLHAALHFPGLNPTSTVGSISVAI